MVIEIKINKHHKLRRFTFKNYCKCINYIVEILAHNKIGVKSHGLKLMQISCNTFCIIMKVIKIKYTSTIYMALLKVLNYYKIEMMEIEI